MRRSRLIIATIIITVSIITFSEVAKYLNSKQLSLLGFSWLIIAIGLAAFNLAKETKKIREQVHDIIGNVAQLVGFVGMAFGFYYVDRYPSLFVGYGIFIVSWLLMFSFLYIKLRKKGYSFWKRRTINLGDNEPKELERDSS